MLAAILLMAAAPLDAQMMMSTSAAGGSGIGVPIFLVTCRDNEAMVGIRGKAATFVDSIAIYCVQLNSNGTWRGEVRATESKGGGGGSEYDRKCPRDQAVSGFRGREGFYIDRLQIQCRRLRSLTRLTGTASYLTSVGGTGGSAFGPYVCPRQDAVAFGILGNAGLFVDRLQLACRP